MDFFYQNNLFLDKFKTNSLHTYTNFKKEKIIIIKMIMIQLHSQYKEKFTFNFN